jgi:hypothetical protein
MLVEALLTTQEEALARMLRDDQNLTREEKSSIRVEESEELVCKCIFGRFRTVSR